ncbi:MAG: hypothetical protein P4K94_09080 [Terracidiphilus sp.]|nr:hypothetical protein [Terracidiphilus sp.]
MLAADAVQTEIDCAHGRVERRRCSVIAGLSLIEKAREWAYLQGRERALPQGSEKTEREIRHYITSLKPDARRLNRAIRQHWGN